MRMRRSGTLVGELALLALCLALAALVYVELGDEPPPLSGGRAVLATAGVIAEKPEPSVKENPVFRPAPLAAYGEVVARPLFSRTRRPVVGRLEGPTVGGSAMRLVGIVVDADGPTAFIKMKDAPRIVRVSLGGAVDGWIVQSIDRNSVTLARDGDMTRLSTKNEQAAEERADGSAARRNSGVAGGRQERPGQKQNDSRD